MFFLVWIQVASRVRFKSHLFDIFAGFLNEQLVDIFERCLSTAVLMCQIQNNVLVQITCLRIPEHMNRQFPYMGIISDFRFAD